MKSIKLAATAAVAVAASALAAGAAGAQALPLPSTFLGPTTGYGTLGYTWENRNTVRDPSVASVTGRLGARFGRYLGVEGEYSYGTEDDTVRGVNTSVQNQYAGYGVAYLPLRPNFDLFARAGYGAQDLRIGDAATGSPLLKGSAAGVNYGAGAQWFFRPQDGVRFDYTRYDPDDRGVATADTYGLSYVRRF